MILGMLRHTKWITRITWISTALVPGSLSANLSFLDDGANLSLEVVSWTLWAVVLIALWVPHPVSLTTSRIAAPVLTAVMTINLVQTNGDPARVIAVTSAAVATLFMYTAEFGEQYVQAGVFGNERRHLLRVPAPLVLPTLLGWIMFVAAIALVPIVVVTATWWIGMIAVVTALPVVWFVPQRLHQLSRRWLVRVPAGWVVHDSVLLADNLLVRTHELVSMRVAVNDTEALDITGLTRGNPLEITLRDATTIRLTPLATRLTKTLDVVHARALLVAPTRPTHPTGP